jgi:DNA-binding NarL/FixJ family response regulator
MQKNIRVLIADRSPLIRKGLQALLSGEPDLMVVGETDACWEMLEQCRTLLPDILVVDISLIEPGAARILELISEIRSEAQTVIVSKDEDAQYLNTLLQKGASRIVQRDSPLEAFLHAVHRTFPDQTSTNLDGYKKPVQPENRGEIATLKQRQEAIIRPIEREILKEMEAGKTNIEIARDLQSTERNVRYHVSQILKKTGARNRTDAVVIALKNGWIHSFR